MRSESRAYMTGLHIWISTSVSQIVGIGHIALKIIEIKLRITWGLINTEIIGPFYGREGH